jgi:hypothetical protein
MRPAQNMSADRVLITSGLMDRNIIFRIVHCGRVNCAESTRVQIWHQARRLCRSGNLSLPFIMLCKLLKICGIKMAVFWVVAQCSLVEFYERFRGPCCLHHQGDYTTLEPRRQPSSYSPPREPQILLMWYRRSSMNDE